ncbi:MAG: lysophospholipid acyltransferase family protein [Rhodospirillales bacterium]
MANLFKRLIKSDAVRSAGCALAATYVRLVRVTGRWQTLNGESPAAFWETGKPFILAYWHNRLFMMAPNWRKGVPITMIISAHRDGQLILQANRSFGIKGVTGSSSKGGSEALRKMVALIKSGECVGITPDGPRGPRMVAQDGVAALARLTGVPVIGCAYSTRRRKLARSWDRFIIPMPFSKGVTVWSDPIQVGRKDDLGEARDRIETELRRISDEADRLTGHVPIPPDPEGVEKR